MHASKMAGQLSDVLERPVTVEELGDKLKRPLKDGTNVEESLDDVRDLFVQDEISATVVEDEPVDEGDAVEASATQAPRKPRSRSPKRGSMLELVNTYKSKGLTRLTLEQIDEWFPGLKDRRKSLPQSLKLTDVQRKTVEDLLDVLVVINNQRLEDIKARDAWIQPAPESLLLLAHKDWQEPVYVYEGVCGHETEITHKDFMERLGNDNSKVPPFYLFCVKCRAYRTALLNQVPGAATPDSNCGICRETTFRGRTTQDRATAMAQSRGDIWENLVAGVLVVNQLFQRLSANHSPMHRKHLELVQTQEQFNEWQRLLELKVGLEISKHPHMGRDLKEHMRKVISDKKTELGLDMMED